MAPSKTKESRCNLAGLLGAAIIMFYGVPGFAESQPVINLSTNASNAEIQRALDRLPSGSEVVLSPGLFVISQPLWLQHDGITLRGSGPSTILRLADNADCPVVVLGPSLHEPKRSAAHLRLADLMIDGNRANQSVEYWRSADDGSVFNNNGAEVWHATDVLVEHVICCRCRSGGLVTAEAYRLRVTDLDAYDNQFDGLACYETQDSQFLGLSLHDNLGAGISLDHHFDRNSISNALLSENDLGVFMRDSCDNTFRNLTIPNSHHHGVFMAQTAVHTGKGWEMTPGTECIGNDFEGLAVNGSGGKAFQVNDATCTDNVISGARFQHNAQGDLGEPLANLVSVRVLVER